MLRRGAALVGAGSGRGEGAARWVVVGRSRLLVRMLAEGQVTPLLVEAGLVVALWC